MTKIMSGILAIEGVMFAIAGGFILEDDIPSLMSFLCMVLCFGFIGIIEAIEEGGGKK